MHFVSSEYDSEHGNMTHLVRKLTNWALFLKNLIVSGLSLHEFEMYYASCQVWFKLAQWFWRSRFLNFVNLYLLFRNYLPLENGMALHLNKLESPSPKDALCQVWLKLTQWFWRQIFFKDFVKVISILRNYLPLK